MPNFFDKVAHLAEKADISHLDNAYKHLAEKADIAHLDNAYKHARDEIIGEFMPLCPDQNE
jgi:hypothetical protein